MFDQLDDPNPPRADRSRYERVVDRATTIRHRRRRRTAGFVAGTVAAGVLGIVGFASYDAHRLDGLHKVSVAAHLAPASPDGAETFLLVGTDRNLFSGVGVTTAGADSILAVRVDPANRSITALQIPRDLRVTSSSGALTPPLRSVFRNGGPSALLTALHEGLGLDVQHYLSIDPAGFVDMVDLVGGTRIKAAQDLRDTRTGLALSGDSCTHIDGATALALARSRWMETREDSGRWTLDGLGDVSRIQRQAILSQALLDSFRSMDFHDPVTLHQLVDALAAHATVDPGLGADSLFRLAKHLHDVTTDGVAFAQLPSAAATDGTSQMWLTPAQGWQAAIAHVTGTEPSPTSTVSNGPTTSTPPPLDLPVPKLAVC